MYTLPTWDGVDWFGCEDDLVWEPLSGAPASTRPDGVSKTPSTRRPRGRRPASTTRPLATPAGRSDAPAGAPVRRLLILDVENVCPGSRHWNRALTRLQAVLKAAGPVDQIVAASAASQYARLDELLTTAGVHVHTRVKNRPDAADRALISAARRFARDGDCEVIVASNDHSFRAVARMPGVRRVVLITVPKLETARSLIKVASEWRVAAA